MSLTQKVDGICVVALFAALPFFSLKVVTDILSPFHLVAIFVMMRLVFSPRYFVEGIVSRPVVSSSLLAYLMVAAISFSVTSLPTAFVALMKTSFYFVIFVAASRLMREGQGRLLKSTVANGCLLGLILFLTLVLYANIAVGNNSGWSFDYYGFTISVFRPVFELVAGKEDFISRDLMRSSLAEIFVLYAFVFTTCWSRKGRIFLLAICVVIALGFFSRRGLLMLILGAVVVWSEGLFKEKKFGARQILGLFVFAMVALLLWIVLGETRYADMDVESRTSQYELAARSISSNLIWGVGFGSQIDGKYVHNAVLSIWYMTGLWGLAPIMVLVFAMIQRLMRLTDNGISVGSAMFVIIPLVGMVSGSTTEGLFTPAGWLALAIALPATQASLKMGVK